ncbi:hypothetical protein L873DRAFT_63924 [Choiromyces venosus 120613-1]|uniref:Uncharacterized protein n=1 Tax=Choiromyces venosus 120613-1 TaxID=1336337 RepID=A0A3N4J9S1_9PEZI|nr:hypothetical protein L873DRAFT_63924 [Choiromyces venosus 120613-1]
MSSSQMLVHDFVKSVFHMLELHDGSLYDKKKLFAFLCTHGAKGLSVSLIGQKRSGFLSNLATILSEEKSKLKTKLQNVIICPLPIAELAHTLFLDKVFKVTTPRLQHNLPLSAAHWTHIRSKIVEDKLTAPKWWAHIHEAPISIYENNIFATPALMYEELLVQDKEDFPSEVQPATLSGDDFLQSEMEEDNYHDAAQSISFQDEDFGESFEVDRRPFLGDSTNYYDGYNSN